MTSSALLLRPSGPLTEDTCHTLRQQLAAAFAAGAHSIAVDLSSVTHLDLAGLRVLAGAAKHLKRRQGALVVTRAPDHVVTLMRVNGMADLLELPASAPLRVVAGEAKATGKAGTPERTSDRRLRVVQPTTAG